MGRNKSASGLNGSCHGTACKGAGKTGNDCWTGAVPSGATAASLSSQGKQSLENWQKYMENGEYLRSIESGEEQNYSFIDGNKNNDKKKNGRVSVLKKLRQKQAETAKRSGKPAQQMEAAADMERRRK